MDGENWEIHFFSTVRAEPAPDKTASGNLLSRVKDFFNLKRPVQPPEEKLGNRKVFSRYGVLNQTALSELISHNSHAEDDRLAELARFITSTSLPFPTIDKFEYWLLDSKDSSPLALLYSCTRVEEQANFPSYPEWVALPSALMPVEVGGSDKNTESPPVNYRVERLVAERAGNNPKAKWFERGSCEDVNFPPFLLKEDWQDRDQNQLCQRYLERQSPRLLMLQGLGLQDRKRLEAAARVHALEVERFYPLYPEIADDALMKSIRVEARFRSSCGEKIHDIKHRWR